MCGWTKSFTLLEDLAVNYQKLLFLKEPNQVLLHVSTQISFWKVHIN